MLNFGYALLLAQNIYEKRYTVMALTVLGVFMFLMVLDSLAKGKYIPKKGPVKAFVIFLFVIIVLVLTVVLIFYK